MCQLREHLARIFFPAHCTCMMARWSFARIFFLMHMHLQDIFFQNHPPPPQKLNGRPLNINRIIVMPPSCHGLNTCASGQQCWQCTLKIVARSGTFGWKQFVCYMSCADESTNERTRCIEKNSSYMTTFVAWHVGQHLVRKWPKHDWFGCCVVVVVRKPAKLSNVDVPNIHRTKHFGERDPTWGDKFRLNIVLAWANKCWPTMLEHDRCRL